MKYFYRLLSFAAFLLLTLNLTGCNDPQVYGSIGVSSGYSSYGRYNHRRSGPRMHGSITVNGRIR